VADLIHALQPAALLNGEPGVRYSSSYTALDRVPEARAAGPWQASASMNGSSGYNQYANNWKSPDQIVFDLVDSVSKGGNYLIGIGPTAEGIIPRPEQTNLENVGTWLKSNAEAIYGAGPTVFGDELRDTRWRCTSKRGKLFITLFQWPSGPLMLNGVKARVTKASFLSDPAHKSLPITQSGARLSIALPKDPPVEGEFPSRIDPNLYLLSLRAHLRRVIVLETVP
jgi:alpha-L-fucosidase